MQLLAHAEIIDQWRDKLRTVTRYNPSSFVGIDEEALVTREHDVQHEEYVSGKIAREEDAREFKKSLVGFIWQLS